MKTTFSTSTSAKIDESRYPEAYIAVNRNRVKLYSNRDIYLKGGTEFQLEIRNNLHVHVAAEITINGKKQKDRLVLSPNQVIYLDRFMDNDKKFLFDTYQVDDNETVSEIIKNNGKISVIFYKEKVVPGTYMVHPLFEWDDENFPGPRIRYSNYSDNSARPETMLYSDSSIRSVRSQSPLGVLKLNQKETGRVAEGTKSDQKFVNINMEFDSFAIVAYEYQILPISQMPVEKTNVLYRQVKEYCSECGRKMKTSWQFCPGCGKKS